MTDMTGNALPARARIFGLVGATGVATFALICTAMQFARTDLDWIASALSNYLIGPYGDVVVIAYLILAVAIVAIGSGLYRYSMSVARSAGPLFLFVVSGVTLAITALSEPAKAYGHPVEWEMVHLAAAETTFLCITVAMLLQSWWMRRDSHWRGGSAFALTLAAAAFVALWIYALWRSLPRGLSQKTVIVLILLWLGWASIKLVGKAKE